MRLLTFPNGCRERSIHAGWAGHVHGSGRGPWGQCRVCGQPAEDRPRQCWPTHGRRDLVSVSVGDDGGGEEKKGGKKKKQLVVVVVAVVMWAGA